MLVIERNSNGTTTVKVKKDWSVARISRAYIPPVRNNLTTCDAYRIQTALLRSKP
jgi:hypothetical protein